MGSDGKCHKVEITSPAPMTTPEREEIPEPSPTSIQVRNFKVPYIKFILKFQGSFS